MEKTRKLIIVGDSAFAEVAFEYFMHDSEFEVVAFSVERNFMHADALFGRPVVPFEDLETQFSPAEHSVFVAVVYTQLNRVRTRLAHEAEQKGFALASYVSRFAFVWRNVVQGAHCFIFENNVVQPYVTLGRNVVLWSGNHIGHHSYIGDNCFVASHAVISGFVTVGANCMIGVNATISNNVTIGADCIIGAGALVSKNIEADRVVKGESGEASGSARRLHRVPRDAG
jgi:sugar O-acyltransferase (sialic acid O-acetyltransferase NeuD family)